MQIFFALQRFSVPLWLRRCGLPRGVDKSQRLPASSADGSAWAIPIIPIRGNWCVIDVLAESGQPALEALGPNRALRGRSSFLLWPRFLPFSTSSHPSSIQSAPPRVVGCLLLGTDSWQSALINGSQKEPAGFRHTPYLWGSSRL